MVQPQSHREPRKALQQNLTIRADDPGKPHPPPPHRVWALAAATTDDLAYPPAVAAAIFPGTAAIAFRVDASDFRLDFVPQLGKMSVNLLQVIELEQGRALIMRQRPAIIHPHVRRYGEDRPAAARGPAPEAVQPSEFPVAELAEGPAAIEFRTDAVGFEKLPVLIEPLDDPPHILGLDKPGLAAGVGMGQAEAQLTLQAETADGIKQEIEVEIRPVDSQAPLGPGPHDRQKTMQFLPFRRHPRGLNRIREIAHHLEPLAGDPGEMLPKLLQAGRPQEAIRAQRHVETAIQQVEDEIDACGVPGRLPSPEGYPPLARRPEKIRHVDEILPRQRLAFRRAGASRSATTRGAGGMAAGGVEQNGRHGRHFPGQALSA